MAHSNAKSSVFLWNWATLTLLPRVVFHVHRLKATPILWYLAPGKPILPAGNPAKKYPPDLYRGNTTGLLLNSNWVVLFWKPCKPGGTSYPTLPYIYCREWPCLIECKLLPSEIQISQQWVSLSSCGRLEGAFVCVCMCVCVVQAGAQLNYSMALGGRKEDGCVF